MQSISDQTLSSSTLSLSPLRNNPILYAKIEANALEQVNVLKSSFNPTRYWLHISIPHFFEAIEERNNESLLKKEYIIESSNKVKGFNQVHCPDLNLNQSIKEAKAQHPKAEIIKCNYTLYLDYTKKLTQLLTSYDKNTQRVDWSEFYLDLTTFFQDNYALSSNDEIYNIVKEIRDKIIEEMKSSNKRAKNDTNDLCIGIGLGANKVVARLSSSQSIKDNKAIIIIHNDSKVIESFISKIIIASIPFISERTKSQLKDLNIFTCKDILTKYVEVYYVFERKFKSLLSIALGIGPDEHEEIKETKPISFQENIKEQNDIKEVFNSLVKRVANEMKEKQYRGKTLTLEVVDNCKKKTKRSLTLAKRFESEKEIKTNGEKILNDLICKVSRISVLRIRLSALLKESDDKCDTAIDDWFKHKETNKNINVIKFSGNNNNLSKGLNGFVTKIEKKTLSYTKDSKHKSKSLDLSLFKNTINKPVKLKTPKRKSKQKKMRSKFTLDTFLATK